MTEKNEPDVHDIIDEMIDVPQDETLDDAPPPPKKKKMSPVTKVLIAGTALIIVFGAAFMFNAASNQVGQSEIRRPGNIDSTPGGENQANSPAYQEKVAEMNRLRADRAAELGMSSMPTPEVIMRPQEPVEEIGSIKVDEKPADEVKEEVVEQKPARALPRPPPPPTPPRPPVVAPTVQTPQAPAAQNGQAQQSAENPYIQSMAQMMGSAATALAPKPMVQGEFTGGPATDAPGAGQNAGSGNAVAGLGNAAEAPDYSPENMLLRPGDVLYAETLTSVNSDMRSSVLAEVVHGPHKGARLVGAFEHNERADRLVVTFENITFSDGRVYDIQAMAVDGRSAETAVASDIERRYVARYAPILASTFISGYAQAKSQPKQTVVGTGDNQQVITEQSSSREAVQAGLAAASTAIASDIAASAPKGPLVKLAAGWPIGILIMDRVLIDEPVRKDAQNMGPGIRPYPGMPSQLPPGTFAAPMIDQGR